MTKKINDNELVLPEFDIPFANKLLAITQKMFTELDVSKIDPTEIVLQKAYKTGKGAFDELILPLLKTKRHLLIFDADNFIMELLQSFYRLRLSIKLTQELEYSDRTDMLERISYFEENFHNEYFIFTERMIRYLNTLKNEYKKYKTDLKELADEYKNIFTNHRDIRNEHIHLKRSFSNNYYKTVITDIADRFEVKHELPAFEEEYRKLQKENIEYMLKETSLLIKETNDLFLKFEMVFQNIFNECEG